MAIAPSTLTLLALRLFYAAPKKRVVRCQCICALSSRLKRSLSTECCEAASRQTVAGAWAGGCKDLSCVCRSCYSSGTIKPVLYVTEMTDRLSLLIKRHDKHVSKNL